MTSADLLAEVCTLSKNSEGRAYVLITTGIPRPHPQRQHPLEYRVQVRFYGQPHTSVGLTLDGALDRARQWLNAAHAQMAPSL